MRFYASFCVYLCVICTFWGCLGARPCFLAQSAKKWLAFSTCAGQPGSPLSLAALRAPRQLPRGGSQVHARAYEENLVVRRSFSGLFLTTKLAGFDAVTLASPCGRGGTAAGRDGEGCQAARACGKRKPFFGASRQETGAGSKTPKICINIHKTPHKTSQHTLRPPPHDKENKAKRQK